MGPFRVKIERPSIQYTCVVLVSFRFVSETTKTLANGTFSEMTVRRSDRLPMSVNNSCCDSNCDSLFILAVLHDSKPNECHEIEIYNCITKLVKLHY